MNTDEIKDLALDACKTPMLMDLHEMEKGLEKWGFKIEDYDNLSCDVLGALPVYLVWLDCVYGLELARENLNKWVNESKFPWLGYWTFVVRFFGNPDQPKLEFECDCARYWNGVLAVKNLAGSSPRRIRPRADVMPGHRRISVAARMACFPPGAVIEEEEF